MEKIFFALNLITQVKSFPTSDIFDTTLPHPPPPTPQQSDLSFEDFQSWD